MFCRICRLSVAAEPMLAAHGQPHQGEGQYGLPKACPGCTATKACATHIPLDVIADGQSTHPYRWMIACRSRQRIAERSIPAVYQCTFSLPACDRGLTRCTRVAGSCLAHCRRILLMAAIG